MVDSISIHAHTPVEFISCVYYYTVGMILEQVFEGPIFDFFRLWIHFFDPLLRLSDKSVTCIFHFIFVRNSEFLRTSSRSSLEKAHSKDFDIPIWDEGKPIPIIFPHTPLRISTTCESFEVTNWMASK